jgi:S-DNA-T family DNA segregation ATPase FtsK/SpoIIIE
LGVRDVKSYNKKIRDKNLKTSPLPYFVILVDEFADLMATSGKELESTLARLAAMSRAVGIHLVLATQRPSIDVITGLIKANIPSRIAFMVASKFDSRIIIDCVGAEKLLGKGDMLFTSAWEPFPIRMQGAFLSEEEVKNIAEHVKTLGEPDYIDESIIFDDEDDEYADAYEGGVNDPLLEKALDVIVETGKASASYLQRRLKIGYNRAARIIEDLEARGIVGPQNGSKPRELLHVPDKFTE